MARASFPLALSLSILTIGTTSPAWACPETPASPPAVDFVAGGALIGTVGAQIVRFGPSDPAIAIAERPDLEGARSAASPDGTRVLVAVATRLDADGVPPCVDTHVWLSTVDVAAGSVRRLARLRAHETRSLTFSPSGRYATLGVRNWDDELKVHLFDLDAGRRLHVLDGAEATWLGEAQLALRDRRGRLTLHRRDDGERVRVLAPPARRLRPFSAGATDEGFFATMREGDALRFARVHLEDARTRLEAIGPALPDRPAAISPDGARGVAIGPFDARVFRLVDGVTVARVRGRPRYLGAALGDRLALDSDGLLEVLPLDGTEGESFGEAGSARSALEVIAAAPDPTAEQRAETPASE